MRPVEIAELDRQDDADGIGQQIVAAVVEVGGRVLLLRRPAGEFRGGEWEFPGGKVDPGEELIPALHREVDEETGYRIERITDYLGSFDYTTRSGTRHRQHTWSVQVVPAGDIRLTEHDAYAWISAGDEPPLSGELAAILDAHFRTR